MDKAELYRRRAAEHSRLGTTATNPNIQDSHRHIEQSYLLLAENEDWLEEHRFLAALARTEPRPL